MTDKTEDGNDALGRISPRRKSIEEPVNPYKTKQPSINEGISIPKATPVAKPIPPEPNLRPASYTFPVDDKPEDIPPPPEKPVEATPSAATEEVETVEQQETDEHGGEKEDELDEIIRGVKSDKPNKLAKYMYIIFAAIIILLVAGVVFYFFFYTKPSAYSKLTTESYNQNSISFSFKYPSVLSETSALSVKNSNILVAYDTTNGTDNTLVDLSALPDSSAIQALKLSPSAILNQIRNGKGSYVSLLNKGFPSNYKNLFGTCTRNSVNTNNQVYVVCSANANGYVDTRLVGADNNYQYILQLYMSAPVWNDNQNVWQQVEKSFNW